MSSSFMAATSGWRAERIPLSTSTVASAALRPCFHARGVAGELWKFYASRTPPSVQHSLTRSIPSFPSPVVHGESWRDGEGGIAAAPSTSGGGAVSRFALAATTATAIATATFALSVAARDARAPLGGLGAVDAPFFPDVAVMGGAGVTARALLEADWNANHAGGFEAVRVVPAPDVRAWPDGDYPLVRELVDAELGASASKVPIVDLDDDGAQARVLTEAEVNGEDTEAAADAAARSTQHLVAMLDAKSRDAPALVVADRDASISALGGAFAHAHVGRPEEFDSVVLSFLYKGPKTWDVLWCDKGAGGVAKAAAARPALTMRNERWVGDYDVFRWTGENGMRAGSGLYVVSQRFLRKLPKRLEAQRNGGFEDVASLLADACAEGGDAACFSYLERKTARTGAKMAALGAVDASRVAGRRVNISWRDTVVTTAPAKHPESRLGALMVGGERAGDAETLNTHDPEALGAAPVVSFDDVGDWDNLAKPKDLDSRALKELVSKGRDAEPKAVSEKSRKTSSKVTSDEDAVELAPKSSKSSESSSKPKAVSEKSRKTSSKVTSGEDAVELAPKSSKSSESSSKSSSSLRGSGSSSSTRASPKHAASTPPPRTTSKHSSTTSKHLSSTVSKHRSSKDASEDSTKLAEPDVDSMLDWWSDLPSATRGTGAKRTREDDDGATRARREERASSKADPSDALEEAASSFLSAANPRTPSGEKTETAPARESTSASATSIQASPVLEREGDLLPDDPETLARRREASREASEGEERDVRESVRMTDASADARAERGRWREEKPIMLHTISPEEALKYVSRVHHKEEVEAADAAAELARQEAEQKSFREAEEAKARVAAEASAADDSYLDVIEAAYDDIIGDRDAQRSWSAVGSRDAGSASSSATRGDDGDAGDYAGDSAGDSAGDYEALASHRDDDASAGVSEDDYDEDGRLISTLAELTGRLSPKPKKLSSRPPTLKKSPHSVDVHAKHARHAKHAARAAASSKRRAAARRGRSLDRSTLGRNERTVSADAESSNPVALGYSRVEARAAAKAAESRSAVPAAPAERLAGGAWRSAFTETQNQSSYASRARSVFAGSARNGDGVGSGATMGARAASLGTERRYGAMREAELAALVEAADGALDDFGPGAKPLAASA